MNQPVLMAATFAAFLLLAGALLFADTRRRAKRVLSRVEEARNRASGVLPEASPRAGGGVRVAGMVASFGTAIASSGLLSAKTRAELERTLQTGGLGRSNSLGLFVGSKIVLAVLLPVLVFLAVHNLPVRPFLRFAFITAAAVGGLMAPDMIIGQRRKSYLGAVEKGLADGLDMMVICAEAGLALEAAIRRVSLEMVHAHPKLAEELSITSSELNLIADPRVALTNMGARTGLDSLKRLGATLMQSIQYGTPLSAALRTLATELRQETLTKFEERAARLPVLLTIPMILFILPCVFLIVAGPIVVQVMKAFKHT